MNKSEEPLFGLGTKSKDTEHFNGSVYVKEILDFDYPMLADTVTFAPGVRNTGMGLQRTAGLHILH